METRKVTRESVWQCCPVCGGKGIVPNGFYVTPPGVNSHGSSSCSPDKCRRCDGLGTILAPPADTATEITGNDGPGGYGTIIPADAAEREPVDERTLRDDIRSALNYHSAENASGTPDFILANFMIDCLDAWNGATEARTFHFAAPPATPETEEPE